MKIVGFKLVLRAKEIQRRAKKAKLDLAGLGLDEAALDALLASAARTLKPAVLFDTFPHPDAEQALLSPIPGLAYSLVVATLGPGFEAFRGELESRTPPLGELWPLLREAGLDEGRRFATSLLEDEAAKDSCELSPLSALAGDEALGAALRKLDGAKIGVSLEAGALAPGASEAFTVSWLSKSKAKGKPK